jgi:hypothetical protein
LAVIILYAVTGWDPMVQLFFWLGTTGGFGVLCLLATTSIAIIAFFARTAHAENLWRRVIAPALAALALLTMVWAGVDNYPTLLGVGPDATVAWALPATYVVAAVVGVLYGILLHQTRPAIYQQVGSGATTPDGPELSMARLEDSIREPQ